jgi:hypothetical protein
MMLKKYISRCYDESYNIHAISFILDYPNSNEVRQWSHIDGFSNTFQGSLSCGNGTSVTMEFPVLQPKISTITDLKKVWTFLPERNNIFSAISQNNACIDMLNQHGKLLNHDPETPLNPISYKRALARFCENFRGRNSPFPAGTIFQMAEIPSMLDQRVTSSFVDAYCSMLPALPECHYMTPIHSGTR